MSHSKLTQGAGSIKILTSGTPNGYKTSILAEELVTAYPGFKYDFEPISFKENEQKQEWFLHVNPNGRIPAAIVYPKEAGGAPHYLFESASIMLWLVDHEDTRHEFSFVDEYEKSEAMSWVFFMHGGLGPMQGYPMYALPPYLTPTKHTVLTLLRLSAPKANHFFRYAPEKIPYAINRYREETKRLYSVLEDRLAGKRENPATTDGGKTEGPERDYIVGSGKGKYSFVDINIFPWVRMHKWAGVESLDEFPNLSKWLNRIADRPAVKRGLDVPEKNSYNPDMSEKEQKQKAEDAKKWIHGGAAAEKK
ncbi:hypothetical protein QFC22_004380 [Naganishia vaughanmartiniae]|uniref:Uncharacterized protein n=1 Tax=Naganishia vaughanmartiniae TaxID=1424756 RepID=A0ACC2X1S5_9TREE|nr:hypothetical protein QFC22_004380 [Naganishia vaughanmartiniae]